MGGRFQLGMVAAFTSKSVAGFDRKPDALAREAASTQQGRKEMNSVLDGANAQPNRSACEHGNPEQVAQVRKVPSLKLSDRDQETDKNIEVAARQP